MWDRGDTARKGGKQGARIRDFRVKTLPSDHTQLVIAKGVIDPGALTEKALAAIGGMAAFVSRGDVVVVKPNIGWDRSPMQAANTNPDVVAAVIKAAYDAGAKHVIVTDASCNDAEVSFQRSGIWKKAYDAGAEVVLPVAHRFRSMNLGGRVLNEWPILTPVLEADKVINVPIAKHHSLAKYTGALKNWYGLLGGGRSRLHQDINMSIADLASFMSPTLTILDATRVLIRNGPQGGNLDDTRVMNTIAVSTDQVALDAYGCTLIGQTPDAIGYLRIAAERGLGSTDWQKLRVKEIREGMPSEHG